MKKGCFILALVLSVVSNQRLQAGSPWDFLIPFRRVDADDQKAYRLTEAHGPWLILATSFAGEGAERQAHDLVLELRRDFNLQAYTLKKDYDFTEKVEGLGLNRYGGRKQMRYANGGKFEEIAVLVGHFESVDDPQVEKTLNKIRYARPRSLSFSREKPTTQRFIGLREIQRRLTADETKRQRGPMGNAFVTRNPILPDTYFNPGGIDSFVEEINRGVEFSLLQNPAKFSVRVATFRGSSTMKLDVIDKGGKGLPSKLEEAAVKAHQLTEALRKQNVEAYEFHDRYESIVTIGSFDSIGTRRADGKIELNPGIHGIMRKYGAKRKRLPGQAAMGLVPEQLNGITFDVQAVPVEVPRKSVAAAYAPNNRLFE